MASPLFILLVHKVGEMRNSMPSTLVCELFDDFVDSVKIGDTVKISGVFVARETRRKRRIFLGQTINNEKNKDI